MTAVAAQIGRLTMWSGIACGRDRQNMFWAFGFFALLLVLFLGALSGGDPAVQVSLTAALVTVAVMANGLFSVGIGLAAARDRGIFRRFTTTPVPGWVVLAAMVLARLLIVIASAVLLVLVARTVFGVPWSGGPAGWLSVIVAGATTFSALGFLIAGLAPAPHVANALANLVFIPLMALGGTTIPAAMLPSPLDQLSRVLPSRAMVDGLVASCVAGANITDLLSHHARLFAWGAAAAMAGAYAWRRRSA